MARDSDLYDFFVSYARADDQGGFVTAFVEGLLEEHRKFKGKEAEGKKTEALTCFFDRQAIGGLDDWRSRIYQGLAASRLFVAFVSPRYFASEWCRREWHAWIDTEIAKHILASGAAPIYIVEVPGLAGKEGEAEVARGVAEMSGIVATHPSFTDLVEAVSPLVRQVRRRQLSPVLPFFPEGKAALRREELRRVLEGLARELDQRAASVRQAAQSFNNVPPYNKRFSGRLDELLLLRERLKDDQAGVITGLYGLGGVGKTELAFTYAHAFASAYPGGRFYVPCDGKEKLRDAVSCIGEVPEVRARISDDERKTPEGYFAAIRRCLGERLDTLGHILLVLDNVDRPSLLQTSETDELTALGPKLHLLATTRLPPPAGANWMSVSELPERDALALLEKHRPFTDAAEREAGKKLVQRLGGFALAVELAAAYLAAHPSVKLTAFVEARLGPDLEGLDTAATDTNVELRRHNHAKRLEAVLGPTLESLNPPERRALEYAAFLPADQVALPWLRALVVGDFPEIVAPPCPGFEDAWDGLCRNLWRLALLSRAEGDRETGGGESRASVSSLSPLHALPPRVVRVHRLVQDLVKRGLDAKERMARGVAIEKLIVERDRVLAATTYWQETWELEPFDALAELWAGDGHPPAAWLLNQVGLRWYHLAQWSRAETLYRKALAIDEKNLGPEHPNVAIRLSNLALLLEATNQLADAELLHRKALAINERTFGFEHSKIARNLNDLAELLRGTSRFAEAEPLMRRSLAIHEKNLGSDLPHFAAGLHNLASLLKDTNRLAEAEPLMRRALAVDEQNFGPEHPDVARDLNNLAGLLHATNRLAEAEPLLRRALVIDERSFGPEHPNAARDLNNLAELLHATNRLAEAEPLLRRALVIDERSFGPNNPNVARDLDNLARLLQATNRFAEAEPLLRRALAIDERSRGVDHPAVAARLNNLASLLQDVNRLVDAELLYRRALAIDEQRFGFDHPSLAAGLNNLAELLRATNRVAEAEPLFRKALTIWEMSLGPDHPNVAAGANNLALLLRATNRVTEAELLFHKTLTIWEKNLGPDHPNVAAGANNLALLLQAANRLAEAEPLMRRALEILFRFTRATGHAHPNLQTFAGNYTGVLQQLGRTPEQARETVAALARSHGLSIGPATVRSASTSVKVDEAVPQNDRTKVSSVEAGTSASDGASTRSEQGLTRSSVCPCGSGKPFTDCHGQLGEDE